MNSIAHSRDCTRAQTSTRARADYEHETVAVVPRRWNDCGFSPWIMVIDCAQAWHPVHDLYGSKMQGSTNHSKWSWQNMSWLGCGVGVPFRLRSQLCPDWGRDVWVLLGGLRSVPGLSSAGWVLWAYPRTDWAVPWSTAGHLAMADQYQQQLCINIGIVYVGMQCRNQLFSRIIIL